MHRHTKYGYGKTVFSIYFLIRVLGEIGSFCIINSNLTTGHKNIAYASVSLTKFIQCFS